jgi:hypothetical protein
MYNKLIVVSGFVFGNNAQSIIEEMSCTTFIKEQPENERWSLDGQKNIFD